MTQRRYKRLFWVVLTTTLALIAIPSATLLQGWNSTFRFLTGFDPGALRQTRPKNVPHGERSNEEWEPELQFVEFSFSAPQARSVAVTGDFTGWKSEGLPMTRRPDGSWEVLIPLPVGRYHYLYIVDGERLADPNHPGTTPPPPGPASPTAGAPLPALASLMVVRG